MQNFKSIMLITVLFMLGGCFWQTANLTDIIKAQQFCEDRLGLRKIDIYFDGTEKATCLNGDKIDLNKYKLKIKGLDAKVKLCQP